MQEVLLSPGFVAIIAVIVPAFFGYLQQRSARKDKFHRSNLSNDEKKKRLIRWYSEHYHRGRMLMIQNNLGHLVDEYLPFEPPDGLMNEDSVDREG